MTLRRTPKDWLVEQLVERCQEGTVVDEEDLSLILSLNIADYVAPEWYSHHSWSYGKAGELVAPNLEDYSRTDVLESSRRLATAVEQRRDNSGCSHALGAIRHVHRAYV